MTVDTALAAFYKTAFVEWVIKNPMVDADSAKSLLVGGVQAKIDEFMRLSIFGS